MIVIATRTRRNNEIVEQEATINLITDKALAKLSDGIAKRDKIYIGCQKKKGRKKTLVSKGAKNIGYGREERVTKIMA